MRKIFAFFLLFSLSLAALPQDTLKFTPNSWGTEVNVNLLDGKVSLNNAINQIKVRHYISETLAHRFSFNFNSASMVNKEVQFYGYNNIDREDKRTTFEGTFNFGIEKHFKGTRRLSPYIGADFGIAYKTSNQKSKQNGEEIEIKGCWREYTYYQVPNSYYVTITTYTERGYVGLVASAFTGVDFYVSKNLFVGIEFQYELRYKLFQKIEIIDSDSNTNSPDIKGNEFGFGARVINGIRIGYVF